MFFKGRSKAFRIYLVKVMVFTIDMYNRNFISVELLKLWIAIDINHINRKCEFLAHALEGRNSVFTEVTSVAGVDGDHDGILAS